MLSRINCWCLTAYFIIFSINAVPALGFDVTNEQLRGAMLTLVSSYNTLENNLERHEIRERALGEVIKKGLQTLHKGQRIFEPMRGTFARLDERISQMESLLMSREIELKEQQTRTGNALANILQWIAERDVADASAQDKQAKLFDQVMAAITTASDNVQGAACKSLNNNDGADDVDKKVDYLTESVKRLRQELAEVLADRSHADESVKQLCVQVERTVSTKITATNDLVAKLEDKLSNFYVTVPVSTSTAVPHIQTHQRNFAWEDHVQSSLESIEQSIRAIQSTSETILALPDRDYLADLANVTLGAIIDMRFEVLTASDQSFAKTATRIKEATNTLNVSISETIRTLSDAIVINNHAAATTVTPTELAYEQCNDVVLQSYADLRNDIAGLRQLEKIMVNTSNNVLAVKRGIEYNVHAMKMEIEELIRVNVETIDSTLAEKFSVLNETIYANHNGALANLTSKIETEISQVWRQIGIMFQLVQSTEMSLNKLQGQTEIYVNGTSAVMDGMGGKVSQITERMAEVDSNLNYLLGRLSLVAQEFNQIKTGLGSALDNIKASFHSVQRRIQDVGPGPHNIENETDYIVDNNQPAGPT